MKPSFIIIFVYIFKFKPNFTAEFIYFLCLFDLFFKNLLKPKASDKVKPNGLHKHPLRTTGGDWLRNYINKELLFVNHLENIFDPHASMETIELSEVSVYWQFLTNLSFCVLKSVKFKKSPSVNKINNKMLIDLPYFCYF